MRFIGFRDTCVISRYTGEKDEWDNEIKEVIYDGPCLYEEGGTGYSRSFITRNPLLFLPKNDVVININDSVSITTEKGRAITSIVEIVRDVNLPWSAQIEATRIELKQSHGD